MRRFQSNKVSVNDERVNSETRVDRSCRLLYRPIGTNRQHALCVTNLPMAVLPWVFGVLVGEDITAL